MSGSVDAAPTNLADLLLTHPFADEQPLLHGSGRSLSAGVARARARALAAELGAAGVEAGHGVGLRLANGPDYVVAMMAIWLAGGVLIPINDRLPDKGLQALLDATSPFVLLEPDGIRPIGSSRTFDADVAFVMWTSGTTGPPKAILHTHSAYLELLDRVLVPLRGGSRREGRAPSPNLIPVSLALNAGIYNALFGLRAGAPLVIMDRFTTAEFARLVHTFEIRSTVLPPAAMAMLNADPDVADLSPLRFIRSITAPLSPLQARRFMDRFGVFVLNSYGQAEIGEVIGWTATDAKEHPEKIGAAGRPHGGVAIKLVGDEPHWSGDVGELYVRPPRMAAGYASGGSLDDRTDDEGFIATGDLARLDSDGFVWIEGRVGDLINRGGNKVFPEEVEEVLKLGAGARDAAVVGIPDERLGEVPVAFVVTDGELDVDALRALCRANLVPYKVPVDFVPIGSLPRTEVGKIRRGELRAAYQARPERDLS
jgi:acyl-CoA synthetase (AMP-forming)/AMP-acid ligase II